MYCGFALHLLFAILFSEKYIFRGITNVFEGVGKFNPNLRRNIVEVVVILEINDSPKSSRYWVKGSLSLQLSHLYFIHV